MIPNWHNMHVDINSPITNKVTPPLVLDNMLLTAASKSKSMNEWEEGFQRARKINAATKT